jgi:hypothetical protein
MDLAKIIAEMRVELQCLDTAIASIEELARVQNIPVPDAVHAEPSEEPGESPASPSESDDPPPVKRPRGRPRKDQPSDASQAPQPMGAESVRSDDPAASVA